MGEPQKPTIATNKNFDVKFCPFCGLGEFSQVETNNKIQCPEEQGGCGAEFLVRKF